MAEGYNITERENISVEQKIMTSDNEEKMREEEKMITRETNTMAPDTSSNTQQYSEEKEQTQTADKDNMTPEKHHSEEKKETQTADKDNLKPEKHNGEEKKETQTADKDNLTPEKHNGEEKKETQTADKDNLTPEKQSSDEKNNTPDNDNSTSEEPNGEQPIKNPKALYISMYDLFGSPDDPRPEDMEPGGPLYGNCGHEPKTDDPDDIMKGKVFFCLADPHRRLPFRNFDFCDWSEVTRLIKPLTDLSDSDCSTCPSPTPSDK